AVAAATRAPRGNGRRLRGDIGDGRRRNIDHLGRCAAAAATARRVGDGRRLHVGHRRVGRAATAAAARGIDGGRGIAAVAAAGGGGRRQTGGKDGGKDHQGSAMQRHCYSLTQQPPHGGD